MHPVPLHRDYSHCVRTISHCVIVASRHASVRREIPLVEISYYLTSCRTFESKTSAMGEALKVITVEEFLKHQKPTDLWLCIRGKVNAWKICVSLIR